MTAYRCDHGELFAVCRDCPPWGEDPSRRYPPTVTEPAAPRSWRTAAVLVAFIAALWWLGRKHS